MHVVLVRLVAGAGLSFLFDTTVFVLTLKKTLRHTHEMRKLGQVCITRLLLRDGVFLRLVSTSRMLAH